MQYKYLPNTVKWKELEKYNIDYTTFLNLQLKYREGLEILIKKYISFQNIDSEIEKVNFKIPLVEDKDYNFYHKFSFLGSKYVFIRNNIHIERLNSTELEKLINCYNNKIILDEKYIIDTINKVMFEIGGTVICYGIPLPQNMVDTNSLTFEFAYEERYCKVLDGLKLNNIFDKVFDKMKKTLEQHLNIKITKIVFNGFDKRFKK